MKKRVAYYVSRKNPLIWLAALVMLASAALRIANVCGKGADAKTVWFLVVLPVVGCVFYVLNILCNGSDRFYRSSVPVILLAIYYGIKITLVSPYLWLTFMFWIAYLAIAAFYAVTVSGHIKSCCSPHSAFWSACTKRNSRRRTGPSCGRFCLICCSCLPGF